jgi:hypothetical protein
VRAARTGQSRSMSARSWPPKEKPPGCSRAGVPMQARTGTGWTRPITRGSGVCRVFADRRLGGTQDSQERLVRRPVTRASAKRDALHGTAAS